MAARGNEERTLKIPVLSVLKKGSVVKNIFLNVPLEESSEPIVVGRHPDCHIVLDHPSISRFHLELRVDLAARKISLVDLCSVHGTWISGRKVEPRVPIDLLEGSQVGLGASTRVYELHWVSLCQVQEMEGHLQVLHEDMEEEFNQEENSGIVTNNITKAASADIPSAPSMPEFMGVLSPQDLFSSQQERGSSGRNLGDQMQKFICSSLPIDGNASTVSGLSAFKITTEKEDSGKIEFHKCANSSSLLSRRRKSVGVLQIPSGKSSESEKDSSLALRQCVEEKTLCKVLFSGFEGNEEAVGDEENVLGCSLRKRMEERLADLQTLSLDAIAALKVEERFRVGKEEEFPSDQENSTGWPYYETILSDNEGYCSEESYTPDTCRRSKILSSELCGACEEHGPFTSDKENLTPLSSLAKYRRSNLGLNGQHSSGTFEAIDDVVNSDKKSLAPEPSEFLGLDKQISGVQVKDKYKEDFVASPLKNLTPQNSFARKSLKSKSAADLTSDNETSVPRFVVAFSSASENLTPGLSEEPNIQSSTSKCRTRHAREDLSPSDKENITPAASSDKKSTKIIRDKSDIEKQIMKRRVERIPLQSLLNSPMRSSDNHTPKKYEACLTYSNSNSKVSCSPSEAERRSEHSNYALKQSVGQMLCKGREGKKTWYMVVDTSCFLDEESRKSLQLLEALKGTQLIIPRMVIRELDYLKRHESWFKRTTSASSALQWIERCMVKESWWVHVQNSFEMDPVAPTPPATPRSLLSQGSNDSADASTNSKCSGSFRKLAQITSPTAEDHILNCALLFKKIKTDGQLVLLTNSIALKIKAMAEGLLCETPKEFRESLVNPFSKRFMWSDSSPKGSTWSSSNDMGLIENFNYYQYMNARKVNVADHAKGLKLILLHDSSYGQLTSQLY